MDKKAKKKGMLIAGLLLLIIIGISVAGYCMRPDGSTMESREKMLKDHPKGTNWTISTERLIEDYLITGIVSDNGKAGIAVFEPKGNGKYRIMTSCYRENDEIILCGAMIGDLWYDLIWFNGAKTERAEVTYTVPNEVSESTVYLLDNSTIICSPTTYQDYMLQVVYYDDEGNRYE